MDEDRISQDITCVNCGKVVSRRESIVDFRLKDEEGRYVRYCFDCKDAFKKAVGTVDDPTGMIFEEGIEVELGDKDPFFRIRFMTSAIGGLPPAWRIVPLEDETGGLLVFVRKVGSFIEAAEPGAPPKLTCKVIITRKSTRVAFAEPYFENKKFEVRESIAASDETEVEVDADDSENLTEKTEGESNGS